MSTESPLVIHTGSLLSNLDQETQARVLELRYMKSPLVEGKTPFAKMIQEKLMGCAYFDIEQARFIRIKITQGTNKLGHMGCRRKDNRVIINIITFQFLQSHLVYLWFTGDLPKAKQEIDHIDGDQSNDFPGNLRIVSHSINCRNVKMNNCNTSGYTGVSWYNTKNKWRAYACEKHIGFFTTAEEAYEARQAWINNNLKLGFTTRHGH